MRRGGVILLLVGCAAVGSNAQEANAPLSNTKQQLQSLKRDQTAEKTKTDSGLELRGAMPTLSAPQLDAAPSAFDPNIRRADNEREAQRKAEARKNWLLDGMDQLERKKHGLARGGSEKEEIDEKPLDPSDPDYFLRVYEKQRAENLAKQEQARGLDEKSSGAATGGADAFAPFMQNWLAGSPVREALKDVIGGGRTDPAASVDVARSDVIASGRTESGSLNIGGASRVIGEEKRAPAAANPFLQGLGLPGGDDAKAVNFPPARPAPALAPPAATRNELTTPELPKTETRLRPPPSPADDKKYFPQLKKF